jgi:hypothetical protein
MSTLSCAYVSGDPMVDRDVAIALTKKLGLHATQPQVSLRIHFHLSCVRLDKATHAIYISNFKNWPTLSPYVFVHFTHLHKLPYSASNKRRNYGLFKGGIFWKHVHYAPLWLFMGARGGTVVEALRYKPEGRRIDSRWCHWHNPSGCTMALGSNQPVT